ncbi:MAG: hypothetical protein AAB601_00675 [Patescibacteria group bacterium]
MKPIYFIGKCDRCRERQRDPCTMVITGPVRGVIKALRFMKTSDWNFIFEVTCLSCGSKRVHKEERRTPSELQGTVNVSKVVASLNLATSIRLFERFIDVGPSAMLLHAWCRTK